MGGGEGREHKVADAEEREMGDGGGGEVWAQDKEEDLNDVMEALKVGKVSVGAENLGDDI